MVLFQYKIAFLVWQQNLNFISQYFIFNVEFHSESLSIFQLTEQPSNAR